MPADDLELALLERAVTLTWQLDRAARAEAARLTSILRTASDEEALRQQEEALALGQQLLFDRRGPLPLYPHSLYCLPDRPRVSSSGLRDDPDDPPRLLLRLEATAAGCRWLLDHWAELRALLDQGLTWQSPDKLKAIRLLGHQPLDAADSEIVATIFQACHVLDPQTGHQPGGYPGEPQTARETIRLANAMIQRDRAALRALAANRNVAELEASLPRLQDRNQATEREAARIQTAWQQCGAAFTELLGELTDSEAREYHQRLEGRQVDRLRPADPAAARATLRAIVERAAIRLEAKLEVHQARAAQEAAEAVDRFCFDASAEGEQLRQFQLAGQRALVRTVDSLLKLRRAEPLRQAGHDPAPQAATTALGDRLSTTLTCGPEGFGSSLGTQLLPAVADPPAAPPAAPVPEHDGQNLRNEPREGGADRPVTAEESPAVIGEDPISRNEPSDPAGEPALVAVEPAIAAVNPSPQPEPTGRRCSDRTPGASAQARGAVREVGTEPALRPTRSAPGEEGLGLSLDDVPTRPDAGASSRAPAGPGFLTIEGDGGYCARSRARRSRLCVIFCTRSSGPWGRDQWDQGSVCPGGEERPCAQKMVEALKTKFPLGPG
jgi:hypothetical protein